MKVLHLIPSLEGGGAERQLVLLCKGLSALGVEVHVAFARRGPHYKALVESGAIAHEFKLSNIYRPSVFLEMWRLVSNLQPDIIQTWFRQMDILGGSIAHLQGIPWIVSERSSAGAYANTLRDKLRILFCSRANAIIANSEAGADYWKNKVKNDSRVRVIGNALPLDEIEKTTALARSTFGVTDQDFLILYAGRFEPGKNLDLLLRSFARLSQDKPAKLLLLGWGSLEEDLKALSKTLGTEANVRFGGHLNSVWGAMKAADLCVSLSSFEGQPNMVLEAVAARCPVLLSNIKPHTDLFDEKEASFVSFDEKEIVRCLDVACTERSQYESHAEAAFRKVSGMTVAKMAEAYLAAYDVFGR